jgi:hypothetical protein
MSRAGQIKKPANERSLAARSAVPCILGLASFVICLGLVTRLEAQAIYVFGTMTIVDTFGPEGPSITYPPEANQPFVLRELWVRLLLPPPLRQRCYTSDPWVCAETNRLVLATPERWDWSSYGRDIGLGSVSAAVMTFCVTACSRRIQAC